MDWATRLAQAIDYLEDHLEGSADMERAAALANCSLFHFCRMFEVVVGSSPAEYVRRRRLSRAALDLAAGRDKVIDVALRYGWDTPESFAKAFKRCFGITPSEARSGAVLETWPPVSFSVILKGDKTMKYRIEEREAFTATGLMMRTTNKENQETGCIGAFWDRSSASGKVGALAEKRGPLGMLGVCYDYRPIDNTFAYVIAIETPATGKEGLPPECETIPIPKATYAVFEAIGPIPDSIAEVWKSAYAEWFPSSEYEHAATPDFEVYSRDADGADTCEVWVPIRKKGMR